MHMLTYPMLKCTNLPQPRREGRRGDGNIEHRQGWVLRFKASNKSEHFCNSQGNHNNSSPHLESNTDLQHHIQKGYTYAIDNRENITGSWNIS
ncbi:hypothetical protein OUZ56_023790 [Daphnia magna]|uniref:Uncharacterized protein n=1 Tax=Daphnia magna TaxID=35525 RepID=A0ABR0AZJ4_9CRUS|nr:hypothetical protein OUZ56_023790 [Daphnia magna]